MSEKFTCKICHKEYASQQSLCNHTRNIHKVYRHIKSGTNGTTFEQKNGTIIHFPNENNSPNICTYCNKVLATRQSKYRHVKTCKMRKEQELTQIRNELEQVKNDTAINNTITGNITGNNNNNNTVNNITVNNNVTINNFNADDTTYFSDNFKNKICGCCNSKVQSALLTYRDQFCSLIGKCALAYYDAHILKYFTDYNKFHLPIPKVVQNLKFNPNHKENNNMKITNMKSDIGQKYQDNKWIYCKKSDMIDESHKIAVSMVEGWINQEQTSHDTVTGFKDYLKVNKELSTLNFNNS